MDKARHSKKIETIIRDTTKFSVASYFANVFDLFTGIIIRRVLGPLAMGVFAELMLVFQYAKYYHLGTYESLDREIPYYNGRGEQSKVKRIQDAGFSFSFCVAVIVCLLLMGASFYLRADRSLSWGLIFVGLLVVGQSILSFFIIIARTHHNFNLLSIYNFLFSLTSAVLTFLLIIKFGFIGAMCALLSTNILAIAYFISNGFRAKFSLKQDWQQVKSLLKIGLPIILYGFVFTTILNTDRFMIITFLGRVDLGYYSVATMVSGYLILIPNLIYTVLFPRFYEAFGREGDVRKMEFQFLTPTLIIAYLLPLVIGLTGLVLPMIIKYFLPQYWPGLVPAYILLIATFFIAMLGMSNYLLIALNKQMRMVYMGVAAIVLGVVLNYFFLKELHLGLAGVALSTLVTFFIYSFLYIGFAFSHFSKKFFRHVVLFIELYAPIFLIGFVMWFLQALFHDRQLSLWQDARVLAIQTVILLIFYLPLFYYINRKTHIISKIIELIKVRLR